MSDTGPQYSRSLYDDKSLDDQPLDAPPPKPASTASRWEDFIDICYAPSTVFARREKSGFMIPMLVVTLVLGALFLATANALQPMMDAEFSRGMANAMRKNPQLTADQFEKMRGIGEKFAKIGAFIVPPIIMFLTGIVLWLVGKFFDAKQTASAAIMVACYSYVPRIFGSVIGGVQALLMDPESMNGQFRISLGIGRFLDPDTTPMWLLALLGRVDLITIWVTVLLAIGLSVTGKIPRPKAAIAAVIVWVIGALPTVLPALANR